MDINISDFGYEIRKYNLKNHGGAQNWIPCLILTLPVSKSQTNGQTIYFKGLLSPYARFKGNMIGLSINLPFWSYANSDKTLGRTFLEVYTDEYFLITASIDGTTKWFKYKMNLTVDGVKVCDNSLNRNPDYDGYYMVVPTFIRTSDGYYLDTSLYNIGYGINNDQSFSDVTTIPFENTNKGILNTDLYDFFFITQISGNIKGSVDDAIKKFLKDTKIYDGNDPNGGGGNSTGGGGGGSGDIGGDTNDDDGLPTIQATDSGLMTLYNPTTSELQSLGHFLWSDQWSLDNFKKLFNDPFDTLLGLSVIPVKPNTGDSKNIMFGNLDSGVSSAIITNQWLEKDMGSVTLNEVWKGALDYSPSTSVSIYLPFIGMRQLNVNDVMGSTVHLMYKFDVLTGTCVAQLYVNHNAQGNKDGGFSWNKNQGLLYEFIGQCSVNIPLASQDFTNTIRAAISAVGMTTGAAASIATGNPALGLASLTVGTANTGMQANTPTVERSGHLSGSSAILGYYQPFLVVERPHQCKPSRYYALRGIPSQVYVSKLADCTGFTQITDNNNIHASGAQDTELEEIERLLASGVYFPNKKR